MLRTENASKILLLMLVFAFVFAPRLFAGPDFKTIDTTRLHSMVVDNAYELEGGRNRPFMIIDTRPKEEYEDGHIFSAINIPEKDFEKSMDLLPKNRGLLLVVYCNGMRSGASRKWASKAASAGYTNLSIYSEGFSVWKEKQMPVAPLRNSF
jgi:rhodanese-related sulfurtransferase